MLNRILLLLCKTTITAYIFCSLNVAQAAGNLDEGVRDLATQISTNMSGSNKRKIAIIEFSNLNDDISAFGQFLAEELITQLYMLQANQFEVVERRQLLKVLNEQGLGTSGLLDADAMSRVGKLLGVDAIVTGSVTDLGNTVKVNARMISVTSAKIFAVAATTIPKVGTVTQLMEKPAKVPVVNTAKTATNATTVKLAPGAKEVLAGPLSLTLDSCTKNGTSIACTVYATNTKQNTDMDIVVYAGYSLHKSRILDNLGRETITNVAAVGNKRHSNFFIHTFVSGIPTPIIYSFSNTASDASSVVLFELVFSANNQVFSGKFRNAPLR